MCSRRFDNLQYRVDTVSPLLNASTEVQKLQQKSYFSFISQDQENTQVQPLTGSPKGLNMFAPRISVEFSVILQGKSSQEKYPVNGVLPDTVIWLLSEHMSCLASYTCRGRYVLLRRK